MAKLTWWESLGVAGMILGGVLIFLPLAAFVMLWIAQGLIWWFELWGKLPWPL